MPLYRDSSQAVGQFNRPGPNENLTVAATADITTNPFAGRLVRLCATAACYYKLSQSPSAAATTSDIYLPPNVIEVIQVSVGDYLTCIRASGDGVLSVTEVA